MFIRSKNLTKHILLKIKKKNFKFCIDQKDVKYFDKGHLYSLELIILILKSNYWYRHISYWRYSLFFRF